MIQSEVIILFDLQAKKNKKFQGISGVHVDK